MDSLSEISLGSNSVLSLKLEDNHSLGLKLEKFIESLRDLLCSEFSVQ